MRSILTFAFLLVLLTSCNRNTFYIVRHAEKATAAANMSSDVPLTEAGQQRAIALKNVLPKEKIESIFSTQTIRTTSTAKPLAELKGITIQMYSTRDTVDRFISRLKSIKKGSVLIVGHSNTVDDLVNKMMGQNLLTDLPETEYDNLFIVKRKGKKYLFERKKY
ncbi:MAG: histidine phosphatase family protein [Chitinophagaceae bacterium]|nr:histidine phosphatase family protein [Chitinophagaceae bacterium]